MTPERIVDAGDARFYVRDGTLDRENVDEYTGGHWAACDFREGDRWLDAGANIGTFSVYAARRARHVVACEPDEDNYRMLLANLELNGIGNVVTLPVALVGNDDQERPFYVEPGKNKGTHSLIRREAHWAETTAPCCNVNDVLWDHGIDCIEMDVEGAEVELIRAIENWGPIRQLYLEYHNHVLRDGDLSGLAEMLDFLRARFDDLHTVQEIRHPLWRIVVARKGAG